MMLLAIMQMRAGIMASPSFALSPPAARQPQSTRFGISRPPHQRSRLMREPCPSVLERSNSPWPPFGELSSQGPDHPATQRPDGNRCQISPSPILDQLSQHPENHRLVLQDQTKLG